MNNFVRNMSLSRLESVGRHVFKKAYQDKAGNKYSPISGAILILSQNVMMADLKELEYYGFKTTMISTQTISAHDRKMLKKEILEKDAVLYQIFVYQDQDKDGHRLP